MKIEKLLLTCNLDAIRDGRGWVFTFFPKDPIVEFNFNIMKGGKSDKFNEQINKNWNYLKKFDTIKDLLVYNNDI